MIITPLPNYPWERIAADLFEPKGSPYLLVADYYSRFVKVQKLTTTTSSNIITQLKTIFARFGIPAIMVTDNGPQFDSHEMKEFAQAYEFQHTTTSQYFPKSNGFAERMVKTVKKLLEHTTDPYKSILSYRATPPPWCGLSPAELLMGRRIRTDIPQVKDNLISKWEYIRNFKELDGKYKRTTMIDTTGLEHFPCYQKSRLCGLIQEDIRFLGKYCRQLAHPAPM